MRAVGGGLELEGRVAHGHGEVLGHARLEPIEDAGGVPVEQALIAHDHMRGQDRQPGGDGPSVQVVDVLDVLDAQDVAAHLGVAKPSVTDATERLKERGFVTTDHAGMLVLTDSGMEIADSTYTKHKMLTKFFIYLGVSPEQAMTDACKIEHDISEETFAALCRYAEKIKSEA